MALQMLGGLKGAGRVLEGFEAAGRLLEQAVSDVGCGLLAAASMLVDDLSLRGARQRVCAKRSPVLAYVRFRPTEGTEGRLRHTDHEVQLAHPGIVPLGLRFDGVLGKASDQAATYERVGAGLTQALLEGQSQSLLVCGAAGADGVLVFDGNVRLRARLRCEASGAKGDAFVAVLVVGRGRQLWSAARDGGVVLWQRASGGPPGQLPEWAWHVCRRLGTSPLTGLCTAGAAQVWAGARDGSVLVWLSEAAAAEAADGVSRRATNMRTITSIGVEALSICRKFFLSQPNS